MRNTHELLSTIISECENGCTDLPNCFEHFARIKAPLTSGEVAFISVLNFPAIRENRDGLTKFLAKTQPEKSANEPSLREALFYVVEMTEYERGFGQRPDGFMVFHTEPVAKAYIHKMTAGRTGPAPDEYTSYHGMGYHMCTQEIAEKMSKVPLLGNVYSKASPLFRK